MTELLALPPDGWALPHEPDSYFAARMRPIAVEFSLVEAQMEAFQQDLDPGTAQYLLPDYLRVEGPDPYGWNALTLSTTQVAALAHARWVDAPKICAGYFIAVAASIGITITIQEFPRSACNRSRCGASQLTPTPQHCVFLVSLPTNDSWISQCGTAKCGDQLSGFQPSVLETFIRKRAPLFTRPAFSYH